jgi:hypothetical protein
MIVNVALTEKEVELLSICVEQCNKINPSNPQVVAESIEFMYKALQRCYDTLNSLIEMNQIKDSDVKIAASSTRHYAKDCLSQIKKTE